MLKDLYMPFKLEGLHFKTQTAATALDCENQTALTEHTGAVVLLVTIALWLTSLMISRFHDVFPCPINSQCYRKNWVTLRNRKNSIDRNCYCYYSRDSFGQCLHCLGYNEIPLVVLTLIISGVKNKIKGVSGVWKIISHIHKGFQKKYRYCI